jgi:N6-adenosine-specific RNA methylase IME4
MTGDTFAVEAVERSRTINPVALAEEARSALSTTTNPAEIMQIEAKLDAVERLMRGTGLYPLAEIRLVNEERMRARWCLGAALESVVKDKPGPKPQGVTSAGLMQFLKQIELDPQTALEARRIAALPDKIFQEAIEQWRARDDLLHYADLLQISRPFWTREKRRETHRRIAEEATEAKIEAPEKFGPFALIYADPPWTFETYSDLATRLPDEHYPVLSDQEIIDFRIFGRSIPEISAKDCALFMWCTSSNLKRALAVIEALGFEYKTQAVWDKERTGTGLIFRNQHEVLLYGSRGSPPKPLRLVPSVFRAKRGRHSAKPREVRVALERMYPSFNADSRIELFCRGRFDSWTCVGYEAGSDTIDDGDTHSVAALELAAPETPEEVREEIERRIAAGELATIEDVRTVKAQFAEIVAKAVEYARTVDQLREENRDLMANAHKKAAEEAEQKVRRSDR